MAEFEKILIEFFTGDGMTIARTVAVFIFGLLAVKLILLIVNKLSVRAHIDKTISSFVLSVVGVLLYFGLLLLTGKSAGISTASFVALISAAGLKDSLSNLANGFIILGSKPFVVGDYVAVNGVEGTVKSIGFFNTKLVTYDNQIITLPNSSLIGSGVVNYSTNPTRRVVCRLRFSYDEDVEKVRKIMLDVARGRNEILSSPGPSVVVEDYTDSAILITLRCWVPTEYYWDALFILNEEIVKSLKENGVAVTTNKLAVKVVGDNKQ